LIAKFPTMRNRALYAKTYFLFDSDLLEATCSADAVAIDWRASKARAETRSR